MATVTQSKPSSNAVLDDVSWDDYEAQLRIIGDRHVRVNYDAGRMEIMSPLIRHGNGSYVLGRMVDTLTDALRLRVVAADPVTLKRADLLKGVEPDKLYFFGEKTSALKRARELDLTVVAPPDLIIEVDVTANSVPRMPIFAAMGILEIWRLEGEDPEFLHLQLDGTYQARDRSRTFPTVSLAEFAPFVVEGLRSEDMSDWIRGFQDFVREVLVPREAGGP